MRMLPDLLPQFCGCKVCGRISAHFQAINSVVYIGIILVGCFCFFLATGVKANAVDNSLSRQGNNNNIWNAVWRDTLLGENNLEYVAGFRDCPMRYNAYGNAA